MRLVLTFDAEHPDRPALPGNAEQLLEVLASEHVTATFFVQGAWAAAYPELVRRMGTDGHAIGNHSWSHTHLPRLTGDGLREEIVSTEALLGQLAMARCLPLFRPPYGDGLRSRGLIAAVDRQGYRMLGWDLDPADWRPGTSVGELLGRVAALAQGAADGATIVFHTWPDCTAAALPAIIDALRGSGAEFAAAA